MTPERWRRIEDLFTQALKWSAEDRARRLREECGTETNLLSEVQELLAEHEQARREGTQPRLVVPVFSRVRPPERIGCFRILDTLGEGGMGIVYKAEQQEPRRTVALKVIRPGILSSENVERFQREVEFQGTLHHPGIAQIFAAGTVDVGAGSQPYFAMELVSGLNIGEYCRRHALSLEQRLGLFAKVCEAVQHAHDQFVVHCDLKPDNILVTEDAMPKVVDFGVARSIDPASFKHLTRTGVLATPRYMSPEQARGRAGGIDARTDVWSLGVILFELLSGEHPYADDDSVLTLETLLGESEPRPLHRVTDDLPRDLSAITSQALAKDKSCRYRTPSHFQADIQRYLNHDPVMAHPPSAWYRLRKFARRYRSLSVSAAVTVLAIAIGFVVSTFLYRQSESNLASYVRMADSQRYRELWQEARAELWPVHPDRVSEMEQWIRQAADLLARREMHVEALGGIEGRREVDRTTASGLEDRWKSRVLKELIAGLDLLALDDPQVVGSLAEMRARRDRARALRRRSVTDHREDWEDAAIGVSLDDRYAGLELAPQVGLVPIGPDPESLLWEFWLVESGERPSRDDATSQLILTADMGMILVLVPPGEFWMGSQSTDPGGPNHDPVAGHDEIPLRKVPLAPFFLSKYEMTQGQWRRLMGTRPSLYPQERTSETADLHPVEQVSWDDCVEALHRLGLVLPTEAQWEYACRAGTHTPWHTGDTVRSLQGFANLADETASRTFTGGWAHEDELEDGLVVHGPVGSFKPNDFGFHDMHGNVFENCRDRYASYAVEPRPGDGLRESQDDNRVHRGGSYFWKAGHARCAKRYLNTSGFTGNGLGVRPARVVEP